MSLAMKKLFLLMAVLMGLTSCSKYENIPLRPVSFEINEKKYYSPKDTYTSGIFFASDSQKLYVREEGGLLDISYKRHTDFINHDMESIALDLQGVNVSFVAGKKISFDLSDGLKKYPSVYMSPVKTSSASDYDTYIAVNGWIEFDDINWGSKCVSGRFEFDAVLEEEEQTCSHDKEIKVENGSFKNIPFEVL